MSKTLYIGLDIDGTVISHCYPLMDGEDLGAIPWLLKAQAEYPVVYLLNTMRDKENLQLAIEWLEKRGVQVGGAAVHPTQGQWTTSPKCHCHIYVEDRAAGMPLRKDMSLDWNQFGLMFLSSVQAWHNYYNRFGPNATGPVARRDLETES